MPRLWDERALSLPGRNAWGTVPGPDLSAFSDRANSGQNRFVTAEILGYVR